MYSTVIVFILPDDKGLYYEITCALIVYLLYGSRRENAAAHGHVTKRHTELCLRHRASAVRKHRCVNES